MYLLDNKIFTDSHQSTRNLINSIVGSCISSYLLWLMIYFHAFRGIQLALVVYSGISGIIVIISSVQRMNMSDYSTGDSSGSVQSNLKEFSIAATVKVLGKAIWYLIKNPKYLILSGLLMMPFGLAIIVGSLVSGIIGIIVLVRVLFVLYEFLYHLNTSSDWETSDISSSKPIIQWMYSQIDIECKAWLIDQKLMWINLTPRQVKTKEILFILDYYRGVFIHWILSTISGSLDL
jgi:hypothetical protein